MFFLEGKEEGKQSKWKLLLALWKHQHSPNKNITICWKAHGFQNCIWVQNWALILVWPSLWPRLIYFFLFLMIYWRLIALQCCVGFCHTIMQVNLDIYIYKYISSPLPFEPASPLPFHPSRSSQSARLGSLCYTAASIYFFNNKMRKNNTYITELFWRLKRRQAWSHIA